MDTRLNKDIKIEKNIAKDHIKRLDYDDNTCAEMLFICFSMFESLGYPGFNELMSVVDNDKSIIKLLRLFGGQTISLPSLDIFRACLLTSTYAYIELMKINHKSNDYLSKLRKWSPEHIDEILHLTSEDKERINIIYDNWIKYMDSQGYPLDKFYYVVKNKTKQRFKKARNSKSGINPKNFFWS